MMKKHRASWTRTAGGAAALSLVAAAGLALATPGFAHEERAQPAEVVMNTQSRDPIIGREDVERLREKCASGEERRGAIVCSSAESRDPEVRAIMEKTRKRVKERVGHVRLDRKAMKLDRKQIEKIRKSAREGADEHRDAMMEAHKALAKSRVHLFMIERGEHLAEMEKALAHARIHLDKMRADMPRIRAMRLAMAPVRIHLPHRVLTSEQIREIQTAMEKAHKEVERIEIHVDHREIDEKVELELERSLGEPR